MELLVSDYGSFLGKKSERLVLKVNGEVVEEIPFFKLQHIIVDTSGATVSTDAIQECMQHGIPISFFDRTGHPYATIVSSNLVGTVITRREQLMAYKDDRGVKLAKSFVEGKLKNQASLLKYFAKYRKTNQPELYGEIAGAAEKIEQLLEELKPVKGENIDVVRGSILNIEGRAGSIYWDAVKCLLEDKVDFPGRQHRGTTCPVNSMLNYGYGILTKQVETSLLRAGLDVFAGFLHVDRSGKQSLVYDFVEEFRQPVVDRVVLAMINKGYSPKMEDGNLSVETRRELAAKILERMESTTLFRGKKHTIKVIIQMQARFVASFLRGEGAYKPFIAGW